MVKIKIKKLNNQGSTFVLALLVIMLLTTLSLALASASLGNMTMKSIDRGSKKTFYTSETLLDEIRAGIGYNSVDNLAIAYEEVLTNIIDTSSGFAKVIDNTEANKQFKKKYIEKVLASVAGTHLSFTGTETYTTSETLNEYDLKNARAAATAYIESYIKGKAYEDDMAKVTSVGHINAYFDSDKGRQWVVVIKDVSVSFKEKKNSEEYFSNITVDLEIEFPNMVVDFTTTNRLTDFTNYSLIADNSIIIAGQKVNVNASAYAGNIIDIGPSATDSSIGAQVKFEALTDSNINIVCGGDKETLSGTIRVGGSTTAQSSAHFQGVNIWCTNIATRKHFGEGLQDATAGAIVSIGDKCNSYVKDDLSVDAQKSNITVAGNYYGYMYDGPDNSLGHVASSAIIVNGRNSKVTVAAKKITLAGRSYVEVAGGSAGSYMTGETLSLKGSQEVYLVPAEFLGKNYGVALTNPMSFEVWKDLLKAEEDGRLGTGGQPIKVMDVPATYFAKPYLNTAGAQYTAHVVEGKMVYVYFKFNTIADSAKYIKDVADGKDATMKAKLDRYNKNLFGGADSIIDVTTLAANINATGLFMESTGGTPGYTVPAGYLTEDLFKLQSDDFKNRYEILTHLLVSLPWEDGAATHYVTNAENSLLSLKGYAVTGSELTQTSIINNIIDMTLLMGNEYNVDGNPISYGPAHEKYVKMAIKGDYVVPDDVNGGIIVATGSITINHDFNGMLLAGGSVYIKGDARFTTNVNMIDEFISGKEEFRDPDVEQEDVPFKQYFYAYKSSATDEDSRESVKIENVDYKDLVNFDNWRKYEDK